MGYSRPEFRDLLWLERGFLFTTSPARRHILKPVQDHMTSREPKISRQSHPREGQSPREPKQARRVNVVSVIVTNYSKVR